MGATENLCANILMSFRFISSSGIADFWAEGNSGSTAKAISFHFKRLQEDLIRGSQDRASLGTALQYRMNPCSTACSHQVMPLLDPRSSQPIPAKFGRKVTRCARGFQRLTNAIVVSGMIEYEIVQAAARHVVTITSAEPQLNLHRTPAVTATTPSSNLRARRYVTRAGTMRP
jgi:hypothetical protein